jgi:S-adenosylmethionine:tRNA ribosyltransferase-isomerase
MPAASALDLASFDYALPPRLIAQEPAEPRDAARLLVVARHGSARAEARVRELGRFLAPGDCLVVNDTRVVPARLFGQVGPAAVELLLLRELEDGAWEALARPARRLRPGCVVDLAGGAARATVIGVGEGGRRRLWLHAPDGVKALLAAHGLPPLPPYIRRYRQPGSEDWTRYQTVYAARDGAVAAPTAGLHFTPGLLAALAAGGVEVHALTLHVGPATFEPVRAACVADHRMAAEAYEVPEATAAAVNRARDAGRRVVAVGTTTVRALESAALAGGGVAPGAGSTELTIVPGVPGVPGHRFRAVDALLTNFHLPRSSLLLLVAAFAGRTRILDAYRHAVAEGYRFYSYGDAMLIR